MLVNKILKVVLLLLGGIFIVLQGNAFEIKGAAVSIVMFVLLTLLYSVWTENKSKYFLWFLMLFTAGNILDLTSYFAPYYEVSDIDYFYYLGNTLYILAYIFLVVKILSSLEIKKVFLQLPVPIIILIVLDVFCVTLVTDTAEHQLTFYEYALEFVYNTIIMLLLSVALINYMYRNDTKSMLFLVASIFIVFSEIIQLAYYYILDDTNLGFVYSLFFVVAFVFFYLQSQKEFTGPIREYIDEDRNI
jgi:hypothetical protein